MPTERMIELDLENLEDVTAEEITEDNSETAPENEETEKEEDVVVEEKSEKDKESAATQKKDSRYSQRVRELVAQRKATEAEKQVLLERTKKLEDELKTFKKVTVTSQKELLKDSVNSAKKQLKIALDSDDHDAVVEAQTALNTAQLRLTSIESIKEEDFDVEDEQVITTKQYSASDAPIAMQDWLEENSWFQNPRNQKDSAKIQMAIGMYNMLVAEGEDPESDDFYIKIDEKLGKKVSTKKEEFDNDIENDVKSTSDKHSSSDDQTVKREKKKISQTVQGASRTPHQTSQSQKNRVSLSPEQQQFADSLGISHKEYAKQLLKIEAASKRGDKMVELF
jgi:hypothetical protein